MSFRYDGKEILKHISLLIKPREKVVIVGQTGAGKSTLAHLILNLLTPTAGQIFINNNNILEIEPSSLRHDIGYAPQEIQIINGSLKDNLLFTSPEATPAQLEEVIEKVNLEKLHRKEDDSNEDILLGERGVKLSKGEKQRIGIARVFLKSPSLCIFDEPFASLDTETSLKIFKNIMEHFAEKTVVFITHHLLEEMQDQKIIYLDHGKVIQIGTHQELSKLKKYQQLFGLSQKRKKTSVQ